MSVKVRFAPSPTGLLQVGNARIALVNWLFARRHGGGMLLRLDDTDVARSRDDYAAAIEEDLRWLGLHWDELARQSERMARYEGAAAHLRQVGRLYPCYETAEELEQKRKLQAARGLPPVYDRAALNLDSKARASLEAQGRRPHWRFRLESGDVAWDDLVRGHQSFQAGSVSDPVLWREDGRPLYTLTSVVDDIELGISHVIRGEDHVANTAAQIQIAEALGAARPAFAHLPLLTDAAGRKLSKRTGDLSLRALREEEGVEAMALDCLLARLGTPDPVEVRHSLNELVAGFDIARFGRAAPKFDKDELLRVNARLLHEMPFQAVAGRLEAMGLEDADAAFWETVRGNLTRLREARDWYAVCRRPIEPVREDPEFLATAAELLPDEPWGHDTWGVWTGALKQATGRKGGALFKPLRKALTGQAQGPELQRLLPLIGRARAAARLRGERA